MHDLQMTFYITRRIFHDFFFEILNDNFAVLYELIYDFHLFLLSFFLKVSSIVFSFFLLSLLSYLLCSALIYLFLFSFTP